MKHLDRRTLVQLGSIAAAIAGTAFLLHAFGLFELLTSRERLLAFIREHRANAVLIFIGLQIIQVIAAPVPGEVSGFVGGIFFGPFWGTVFSTIGLTLGSWAAFGLARFLGRPLVVKIVSEETLKRYDYVMKHKGLFLAFLLFLIPGFPKDLLCYILGLGRMGQRDFLIVSTFGRLLGTTLLSMGGTFFRDGRYGAFFTVAAVSIALILVAMIYRERLERLFRKMRAAERLASMAERRRMRKELRKEQRRVRKERKKHMTGNF